MNDDISRGSVGTGWMTHSTGAGSPVTRRVECAGTGAGGGLRLVAPLVSGGGTISADKGRLYTGGNTGGGLGRVRIEACQKEVTGSIIGVSRIVTLSPNAIILSDSLGSQSICITQLAGLDVAEVPSGNFLDPDISINSDAPIELTVEAQNILIDATRALDLYPETGPDVAIWPMT